MKIVLTFIALFFLFGVVLAWEEGDVFTREQYNARNLQIENLHCRQTGEWRIILAYPEPYTTHYFTCLGIEHKGDNQLFLKVVAKDYPISILFSEWVDCILRAGNFDRCIANIMKPKAIAQIVRESKALRSELQKFRKPNVQNLPFERFTIDENELN